MPRTSRTAARSSWRCPPSPTSSTRRSRAACTRRYVFHAMCEKLYDVDQNAKVVPQLATALPTDQRRRQDRDHPAPRRHRVRRRHHVRRRGASRPPSTATSPSRAPGARASSARSATVTAKDPRPSWSASSKPFAPLTAALADRAGMIVSPRRAKALGDKFATAPVCVGPFKFAKRVPQNSIELVKDPNYYDADKVHLDKIVYRIITDASIRAANLRSGDVQVADSVSAQDVAALQKEQQPPGAPVAVARLPGHDLQRRQRRRRRHRRQADRHARWRRTRGSARRSSCAIDRGGLVKVVFNGFNTAPAPRSRRRASSRTRGRAEVPAARPRQGQGSCSRRPACTTPYKIDMITSNTPDSLRLAQALQAMVKEGGFDLQIKPVEYASLLDQQDRGKFAAAAARLVRPDRPGRQHHQLRRHRRQPERRRLQRPDGRRPARQGPAESSDLGRAQGPLRRRSSGKLQQDDPMIYLYRQRNLTGVSDVSPGRAGLPRRRHPAGLRRDAPSRRVCAATCSTGPGSPCVTLLLATIVVFLGVRALPG